MSIHRHLAVEPGFSRSRLTLISTAQVVKQFYHLVINQMLSAIDYLSRQGVVHCDIKPENILSDETQSNFYLADFGFAVNRSTEQYLGGTPLYRAPEVWQGYLDYSNDVWSLGTVGLFILNLIPRSMKVEGRRQRKEWFRYVKDAKMEGPIEIQEMLVYDHQSRKPAKSITRARPGKTHPSRPAKPGLLTRSNLRAHTPPHQMMTRSRGRQETETSQCDTSPRSLLALSASTMRSMSVAPGCRTTSAQGSRRMEIEPPMPRSSPPDRACIDPINPLTPPNRTSPPKRPARSDESERTRLLSEEKVAETGDPSEVHAQYVRIAGWARDGRYRPGLNVAEIPEGTFSEHSASYHMVPQRNDERVNGRDNDAPMAGSMPMPIGPGHLVGGQHLSPFVGYRVPLDLGEAVPEIAPASGSREIPRAVPSRAAPKRGPRPPPPPPPGYPGTQEWAARLSMEKNTILTQNRREQRQVDTNPPLAPIDTMAPLTLSITQGGLLQLDSRPPASWERTVAVGRDQPVPRRSRDGGRSVAGPSGSGHPAVQATDTVGVGSPRGSSEGQDRHPSAPRKRAPETNKSPPWK